MAGKAEEPQDFQSGMVSVPLKVKSIFFKNNTNSKKISKNYEIGTLGKFLLRFFLKMYCSWKTFTKKHGST